MQKHVLAMFGKPAPNGRKQMQVEIARAIREMPGDIYLKEISGLLGSVDLWSDDVLMSVSKYLTAKALHKQYAAAKPAPAQPKQLPQGAFRVKANFSNDDRTKYSPDKIAAAFLKTFTL